MDSPFGIDDAFQCHFFQASNEPSQGTAKADIPTTPATPVVKKNKRKRARKGGKQGEVNDEKTEKAIDGRDNDEKKKEEETIDITVIDYRLDLL